jgi:hypothetical protein
MGCRIIHGNQEHANGMECAVMFCSTTGWAFGPVFANAEQAERFIDWVPLDPRTYNDSELEGLYGDFLRLFVCECGELRDADPEVDESDGTERFECDTCRQKRKKARA